MDDTLLLLFCAMDDTIHALYNCIFKFSEETSIGKTD